MIHEATIKIANLGLAGITGSTMLATVDSVANPSGIEGHLTLATAAVACSVTLFAALKWAVGKLLESKDAQIEALRIRETKERERADEAEQRERDLLAHLAKESLRTP